MCKEIVRCCATPAAKRRSAACPAGPVADEAAARVLHATAEVRLCAQLQPPAGAGALSSGVGRVWQNGEQCIFFSMARLLGDGFILPRSWPTLGGGGTRAEQPLGASCSACCALRAACSRSSTSSACWTCWAMTPASCRAELSMLSPLAATGACSLEMAASKAAGAVWRGCRGQWYGQMWSHLMAAHCCQAGRSCRGYLFIIARYACAMLVSVHL